MCTPNASQACTCLPPQKTCNLHACHPTHTPHPALPRRQQVWRIGEGLPFLEATAALRDACLRDLASGSFWAAADGPSGAGSSSGQQYQPEEFPQLLACIAAAPSGAKLLAVLCQALGAEWRCTTFTGEASVFTAGGWLGATAVFCVASLGHCHSRLRAVSAHCMLRHCAPIIPGSSQLL